MEDLHQDFKNAKNSIWRVIANESVEYIENMEQPILRLVDFLSSVVNTGESPAFVQESIQLLRDELGRLTEDSRGRQLALNRLSAIDFPEKIVRSIEKYDISVDLEELR